MRSKIDPEIDTEKIMNKHENYVKIRQQIIEQTKQWETWYCLLILQNHEFYRGKNNISEKSQIPQKMCFLSKARPQKHDRNSDAEVMEKSSNIS